MIERNTATSIERNASKKEVDVRDIYKFAKSHFFTLLICLLLGAGTGAILYIYLPKKWEADITLQIGKVPILNQMEYIETPAALIEKIKSSVFLSKMLSEIYGDKVERTSPTAALFYEDFSVSNVRDSNLITLHVFGWSREEAYKNADVIAAHIVSTYEKAANQYLRSVRSRLDEVSAEIRVNDEVLNEVNLIEKKTPATTDTNALLKLALLDGKINRIQMLHKEKTKLEELLSATQMQPTTVAVRSLPPLSPFSPRRGLLIIGGSILGLWIGLLLSFLFRLRRRDIAIGI